MANNYLTFNGTDQYVTVPHDTALDFGTDDFTICGWVNTSATIRSSQYVLRKGTLFSLLANNAGYAGTYRIVLQDTIGGGGTTSLLTFQSNTWTFFAITKSGNTQIYYINGGSQSLSTSNVFTDNTDELLIGRYNQDETALQGSLDDIRIYKSALTQENITNIYNGGQGKKYTGAVNEGGVASWASNCDDGVDVTLTDEVGGIDGTLSSSSMWASGGVALGFQIVNIGDIFMSFVGSRQEPYIAARTTKTAADSPLLDGETSGSTYQYADKRSELVKFRKFMSNVKLMFVGGDTENQACTFKLWGYRNNGPAELIYAGTLTLGAAVAGTGLFYVDTISGTATWDTEINVINRTDGVATMSFDNVGNWALYVEITEMTSMAAITPYISGVN